MNNNHLYRPCLTGNKNRKKIQDSSMNTIFKVQSNKNANLQSSLLFGESLENDVHFSLINRSIDVQKLIDRQAPRLRMKTEVVKPKYQLNLINNQATAYFPRLRDRTQSYQKKTITQKALFQDEYENRQTIIELQRSLDCSETKYQRRDLTPINQKTIEVSKSQSKSEHLNQEEVMQFSFGLQQYKQQKQKFPRDIFLGDVRKVKRIFQQQ